MLLPNEFSVGYVGDVTQLTLVLPVDAHDRACLVTTAQGTPTLVVVDERDTFASFECENNTSWRGILVPNIAIELDENSTSAVAGWSPPLGMMVRREDGLFISARFDGRLSRNALVPILTGLPRGAAQMAVGFKKWQIVIGEGQFRRTLISLDTEQANKLSGE